MIDNDMYNDDDDDDDDDECLLFSFSRYPSLGKKYITQVCDAIQERTAKKFVTLKL